MQTPTFTGTVSGPTDVIAELPPNEPITLEILDSAAQPIELTRQVVNSGAAVPGPANPNPPPGTCNSDAYLAVAPTDALGFDPNNLLFSPGGFLNYYGLGRSSERGRLLCRDRSYSGER